MDQQAIFAWCDAHFEEQLHLLKTLAAIPAPSHQEHNRAEFIRDWLISQGASRVEIDPALNVVLPFGCDTQDKIRVYMAHTDVVFPDTDPLPVREEDGKLFAPGVGDDTANVTALMLCAKFFLAHPECLKTPVLMVFNSCEEGFGNLKGVRQIMADYAGRVAELISFDLEFTSMVNRAVGSERWRVRSQTCGGHSYSAFGNPNAIAGLSKLICRLYNQSIPTAPDSKTTYNVGTIRGGTSVNTIAQDAEMTYEYRSDNHSCLNRMRRQFLDLVAQENSDDVKLIIEPLGERPCGNDVPEQEQTRLLNRCAAAVHQITGKAPKFCSASTDANIPLSLGIPATTFGLYLGAKSHTREEYIEIESLKPGLRIALTVLMQE